MAESGVVVTSGENEEEEEIKSPISVVYEMAFKRNMGISYEIVKEVGPAHMKVFTVQCKVGEQFTTESDGFTKQVRINV
jgi:double-stranded RNA-binding protein Staufen